MGFKILGSGRGKHHWWLLETPTGCRFKAFIPHDTEAPNFWGNWKSQLRRRLNESNQPAQRTSH